MNAKRGHSTFSASGASAWSERGLQPSLMAVDCCHVRIAEGLSPRKICDCNALSSAAFGSVDEPPCPTANAFGNGPVAQQHRRSTCERFGNSQTGPSLSWLRFTMLARSGIAFDVPQNMK